MGHLVASGEELAVTCAVAADGSYLSWIEELVVSVK